MTTRLFLLAFIALLIAPGCSQKSTSARPTTRPDVTQSAASGDIPDTQVFVPYTWPGEYVVLFPEGWSRAQAGARVTFTWHFDGEQIALGKRSDPVAFVRTHFRGARDVKATRAQINGAPATVVRFTSLSQSDPVTNRSVALDNVAYFFTRGSRYAALTLWAPKGSDNVDQWRKISESFRWK